MKRLLVFHPIIAPYRIDFFNCLSKAFDMKMCMMWRNLHDQTFDYSKIEAQLSFTEMIILSYHIVTVVNNAYNLK